MRSIDRWDDMEASVLPVFAADDANVAVLRQVVVITIVLSTAIGLEVKLDRQSII